MQQIQQQFPSADKRQYSMQSMLWITTAAALLLAYARNLGTQSHQLLIACAAFWLAWSVVFSLISHDWKETSFWSALILTQAFLAVSAVRILGDSQKYGWAMVGAACGAYCGTSLVKNHLLASILSATLGAISIYLVFVYFEQPLGLETTMDLIGAAFVGSALWFFVYFLRWMEQSTRQPRPVLAAWLTLCVLGGNTLVYLLGY